MQYMKLKKGWNVRRLMSLYLGLRVDLKNNGVDIAVQENS